MCTKFHCIVIFLQGLAKDPNILSYCLHHLGRNLLNIFGPAAFWLFGHEGNMKLSQLNAVRRLFLLTLAQKYIFLDWKTEMFSLHTQVVKFHNRGSASREKKYSFTEIIGLILQWVGWYGMVSSFCHSVKPRRRMGGK